MSKDTDKTPWQHQAARISFKLAKVMEELHFLAEEVIALQQLAEITAEIDSKNWGKGKWVADDGE